MISHLLNKLINFICKKNHKPKSLRTLEEKTYDIFRQQGEGLYYQNIQGVSNNIVAKIIEKYSGGLTHCMWILYSENLKECFTDEQWEKMNKKWNYYYGVNTGINENCKLLVLGSADQTGMNFFDFANYQHRIYSLRKPELKPDQEFKILEWLLKDENMNCYYDYIGLALWPINKLLRKLKCKKGINSKQDYFCSEQLHESLKYAGINLFPKFDNPSPLEIEEVKKEWIVYKSDTFPY